MHRLHVGRRRAMRPWTSLWGWPLHSNAASADLEPLRLILELTRLHPKHTQLPARTVTLHTFIYAVSAMKAAALSGVTAATAFAQICSLRAQGGSPHNHVPPTKASRSPGPALLRCSHAASAVSLGVVCVMSTRVDAALRRDGVATVRWVAILDCPVWQHLCSHSLTGVTSAPP